MNQDSSKEESGTTLPEQWKLSRMIRQYNRINRTEDNRIRGIHQATIVTQPINGNISNSIDIIKTAERKPMPVPLTLIEKKQPHAVYYYRVRSWYVKICSDYFSCRNLSILAFEIPPLWFSKD